MKILITGATGFFGQEIVKATTAAGHDVSALLRAKSKDLSEIVQQFTVGDFIGIADGTIDVSVLLEAMQGIDVIIHTAARAHVMHETHSDPAAIYQLMNVTLTKRLAEMAAAAGVKRFVFISTIKVNGETAFDKPFTENDMPAPVDDYGRSKLQAEQALLAIGQQTGMETVILRPPLVYGPSVKGNFASLIKIIKNGIPLPFGNIQNQRAMIALDNLVSAALLASTHPDAANQTYLVADNEVVSTTELLQNIAAAQGKKAWLLPVPVSWMKFVAKTLGKQAVADRLFGSLVIDTSKIRQQLGWQPIISMQQQLKKINAESNAY